jgi:hypothetical protein
MRRSGGHDPERGLLAALKIVTIVAAVALLALVAGKSSYTPVAGAVVTPAFVLPPPARDDMSRVAASPARPAEPKTKF